MLRFLLYLLPVFLLTACVKAPEFPNEPVIKFESLSKVRINQANANLPKDSIRIHLTFTDGDGDLGQNGSDSVQIILTDSRSNGRILAPLLIPLSLPDIPAEGTGNGISGDIFITFENEAQSIPCIANRRLFAQVPELPFDTVSYTIQIRDRADNLSNIVRTDLIEIVCF